MLLYPIQNESLFKAWSPNLSCETILKWKKKMTQFYNIFIDGINNFSPLTDYDKMIFVLQAHNFTDKFLFL